MHHNWIDASCNHSQVQGQCAPGTDCKERLNISKDVYDNVFVATKADFPPEAQQVMLAAGPTLKTDDDGQNNGGQQVREEEEGEE